MTNRFLFTNFAIACSLALLSVSAFADPISASSPERVARLTLTSASTMPTTAEKVSGFTAASAAKTTLGIPLSTSLLDARELTAGIDDAAAQSLLIPLDERIFPVLSGTQVVSSVTVHKRANQWVLASVGAPQSAKLFSATRTLAMRTTKLPATAFSLVRLPELNMILMVANTRQGLTFWSPIDVPSAGIAANTALSAGQLASQLLPLVTEQP